MELLPLQVVKDQKAQEQTRDILRVQEIKEALNKINRDFAKAQTDFNAMLFRNRTAWATEEEAHFTRTQEMNAEVRSLEARKAKALEPLTAQKVQAEQIMLNALEANNRVIEKSHQVDETRELLEEKLSEVGEREVDVAKREDQVLIKEQANEVETNIIKNGMIALQQYQKDFKDHMTQEEKGLTDRKIDLQKREINMEAREEKVKRDTEAIEQAKVQIADAQDVIRRERERLNIPV